MSIGIITMHRVPNFGSALQAYALQQKLFQHGYDNTLINYIYSYAGYEPNGLQYAYDKMKYYAKVLLKHPVSLTRFHRFRSKYLKMTWHEYTRQGLEHGKVPKFDVYMTGSDQVWNCKFTQGDTNFLLKFAPKDSPRISYGASFASSKVPKKYERIFEEELPRYDSILVREHSGVSIVRELAKKDANVVCDPTLLLAATDYHVLASKSKLRIEEPFVLVYILDYMYNPYPYVYDIIRKVKAELKCKVVYIGTDAPDPTDKDAVYVGGHIGPLEFLWLMENTSFVITTSFHGTAFATIFHKPLLSVVQDTEAEDGRMQTLLRDLKQEDSLVAYNHELPEGLMHSQGIITNEKHLATVRARSEKLLINSLKKIGYEENR